MHLTGEQLDKAYRSMCAIRQFGKRMHTEFSTGQISGFVHPYASMHRGHGYSIMKGAES